MIKRVGTFLALSALVILFSIPIFTAGAALSAGYYVGLKVINEEEYHIWHGFWYSFKDNFKQSISLTILVFGIGGLLLFAVTRLQMQRDAGNGNTGLFFLLVVVSLGFLFAAIYVFPLLAKFVNTTSETLRLAVGTAFHFAFPTIIMTGGVLVIFWLVHVTSWWVGLLCFPAWFYATCVIDAGIFNNLIAEKEEGQHDSYGGKKDG